MTECTFAIYENEISECILYCFIDFDVDFKAPGLYTFLQSQFDVLPVLRRVDVRTTFILSVKFADDSQKVVLETKLEENKTGTPRKNKHKQILAECRASVLGRLCLPENDKSSQLPDLYLSILQTLYDYEQNDDYGQNGFFGQLTHTNAFSELSLPFFYLAHGIARTKHKPNIFYAPAVNLKGLIRITLDETKILGS
tara:strand:+ start:52 stop:642 length:591 start_codon:yes stop_codon:yes gene_type:complete